MRNKSFLSSHHILITAGAVAVSFVVFMVIYGAEQRDIKREFENIASSYHALMEGRTNDAMISLDTVAHSVEVSDFVKRYQFSAFAERTIGRMNELKAFFWVPVVSHSEIRLLENENWNFGLGGKPIFDSKGVPLPHVKDMHYQHLPLLYIEPAAGSEKLIGFDLSSDPEVLSLFKQARDYDVIVPVAGNISKTLVMADPPSVEQIINLIRPVYENHDQATTIGLRRDNIRGYVIMQIDMALALEEALAEQSPQGADIYFIDAEADIGEEIIYYHKSGLSTDTTILPYKQLWNQSLSSVTAMSISGRQWKMVIVPTDEFFSNHHSSSSWILLVAGLILSGFLYYTLLHIYHRDIEVRDIVRMRTKELRESETKVRSILDNVAEGIITISTKGIIETINPVAEKIFGYNHDEIAGKNINILIPDVEREEHDKYIKDSKLNAPRIINKSRDLFGLRKDGQLFPMELNVSSMELEGERKFIGIMHDITERKLSEETLRKAMQGLEQSADAIFITDKSGKIEYVNRKFVDYTGYEFDEVKGKNPRILSSGNTSDDVYKNLWQTILSGGEWRGEIQDKRKDGTLIWASVTISPVRDGKGTITHFVSSHRDITKRKEAEYALNEAMQRTEIANKAKSELMANMSHELRTPLNAIIGFSDLIINSTFGKLEHKEYSDYIDLINNSGRHLLDIINDILDVSAIEAGKVELNESIVVMEDAIATVTHLISQRADEGKVSIKSEVMEECPSLVADERRIKQILLNLVSNSVKFTPEGGSVMISCKLDDLGRPVLSVSDTGIGMSDDELTLALSQFGQVDGGLNRKNEGTGLGLPLTMGLIQIHGGEVEINSEKGKGTIVQITFPAERLSTPESVQSQL